MAFVSISRTPPDKRARMLRFSSVLPDLTDQKNVELLDRWDGAWSYLTTVSWVKVSAAGAVKPSGFPPKGSR